MLAFPDFPKTLDILAVAKIESTYNEKARNGISRGVMQVNHGPWELSANVTAGVNLLREYYERLGSVKAAIIAYNIGIGNYLKGKRNEQYFGKWRTAKHEIGQSYPIRTNYLPIPDRSISTGYGIYGHAGSTRIIPIPEASYDSVFFWSRRTSDSGNPATGEIHSDLGQVKE